jgi:hypothetical protein
MQGEGRHYGLVQDVGQGSAALLPQARGNRRETKNKQHFLLTLEPHSTRVNHMNDLNTIRELLIARAQNNHKHLKQYDGLYASYKLVRITRKVVTKMGLAFEHNEVTIAKRDTDPLFPAVCAYSFKNRVDTGIGAADVEWLEE